MNRYSVDLYMAASKVGGSQWLAETFVLRYRMTNGGKRGFLRLDQSSLSTATFHGVGTNRSLDFLMTGQRRWILKPGPTAQCTVHGRTILSAFC